MNLVEKKSGHKKFIDDLTQDENAVYVCLCAMFKHEKSANLTTECLQCLNNILDVEPDDNITVSMALVSLEEHGYIEIGDMPIKFTDKKYQYCA